MMRPLHQGISVPDMEASVVWYEKVFGFRKLSDDFVPPLNARIVFLELGDFQLELFQYMGEDGKPLPPDRLHPNEDLKTCGTKHVAWSVEDLRGLSRRLEEQGVDVVLPVFVMNGDLVSFIRDNSGVLIELIQINGAAE